MLASGFQVHTWPITWFGLLEVRGRTQHELGDLTHFPSPFSEAIFVSPNLHRWGATCIRFAPEIVNNFYFNLFKILIMLLHFETRAPQGQIEDTFFCTFWRCVKIMGGIGEMSSSTHRPIIRAPVLMHTLDLYFWRVAFFWNQSTSKSEASWDQKSRLNASLFGSYTIDGKGGWNVRVGVMTSA